MEYRTLGVSGLKVSEIAYGSWITFSNQVELDGATSLIEKAFELGINYIDTADVYARGAAETLLGEILPRHDRGHYVVATKAYWPFSDHPTNRGLSRKHLVDSVHASLRRMKLDYVDVFYCHRYDAETPLLETLRALEDLINQGKILYWGTSEWEADQISEAHAICTARGWHPPVVNQPNFSLVQRKIEARILPTTRRLGMGTACFSPLAQGILTGKYSGGVVPKDSRGGNDKLNVFMRDSLADGGVLDRVDRIAGIGEKYGLSIAQTALAWILGTDGLSSVIIGATKPGQLEENTKASGVSLSEADRHELDELFPAVPISP